MFRAKTAGLNQETLNMQSFYRKTDILREMKAQASNVLTSPKLCIKAFNMNRA